MRNFQALNLAFHIFSIALLGKKKEEKCELIIVLSTIIVPSEKVFSIKLQL